MLYRSSDEDSFDSDSGIRFKTTNVRNTEKEKEIYKESSLEEEESMDEFDKKFKFTHSTYESEKDDRPKHQSHNKKHHKYKESKRSRHGARGERHKRNRSEERQNSMRSDERKPTSSETKTYENKVIQDDKVQFDASLEISAMHGPVLPPHLLNSLDTDAGRNTRKIIGPALPTHLRGQLPEVSQENSDVLEIMSNDSDLDDFIGPLPAGHVSNNSAYVKLEERAIELKLRGLDRTEPAPEVRESWMIELPDIRGPNLGLVSRQFREKGVPDMTDRSGWTDTPNTKKEKKKELCDSVKLKYKLKEINRRDEEQGQFVDKFKKENRSESLLQMHRKELEMNKNNKSSCVGERRPFSRDIDLQSNKFDEAEKKAILRKAQQLDDRFSSGESKFL